MSPNVREKKQRRKKEKNSQAWGLLRPDISSEERFVNRSYRIRRHVILWLDKNVGREWNQLLKIAEECANDYRGDVPFSSTTSYRWINQFTAPNFAFGIDPGVDSENGGYQIFRRRRLTRRDFIRWGIRPPKRFRES